MATGIKLAGEPDSARIRPETRDYRTRCIEPELRDMGYGRVKAQAR